jgi:hypothetical protein
VDVGSAANLLHNKMVRRHLMLTCLMTSVSPTSIEQKGSGHGRKKSPTQKAHIIKYQARQKIGGKK